jgi:hypothetical protein
MAQIRRRVTEVSTPTKGKARNDRRPCSRSAREFVLCHLDVVMLSNLQIALALGGKVHGRGVLCPAPAPDRGPDDSSLSITSNEAGDDFNVEPAAHRDYVEGKLDRAIAASRPATPPRPRPSPDSPPMDFSKFTKLRRQPADWIEQTLAVKVVCIEHTNAPAQSPRCTKPVADRSIRPTMRTSQPVQ